MFTRIELILETGDVDEMFTVLKPDAWRNRLR